VYKKRKKGKKERKKKLSPKSQSPESQSCGRYKKGGGVEIEQSEPFSFFPFFFFLFSPP
jgi:hypothetical protein